MKRCWPGVTASSVCRRYGAIERAGGVIKFAPPTASGMVFVTLILPDRYTPQEFLPDLPFYPA
jgi:hypothetical protein